MKIVCRSVEYNVQIVGTGETLVLLHGFTGSTATWEPLVPLLSPHYKMVMVDIIGHGKTASPNDWRRYMMAEAVADLYDILKQLKIDEAFLLGYSMGGRLALNFAVTYPKMVKKLILESSSPGLQNIADRENRRIHDEKLAKRIQDEGLVEFISFWEAITLFQTQQKLPQSSKDSIRNERLGQCEKGLANSLLGMGTGSQPSLWNRLGDLPFPVLLLSGELDGKFCRIADEMDKLFINSTRITINDTGHAIHVENVEKFGKIISEFLKIN